METENDRGGAPPPCVRRRSAIVTERSPLRSVAWSMALHGLVVVVLLVLAKQQPAAAPVHMAVEVREAVELTPPPPPPPSEFTPPERTEIHPEIRRDLTPPDDIVAEEWEQERSDVLSDRVRATITCPDPLAAGGRFAPRRVRRNPDPEPIAAAPPPPPEPVFPVHPVAPPPPPPTPAGVYALVKPVYPRTARERGIEGSVTLRVVIEADGTIGTIDVVTSSGYAVLDRAAVAAVEDWTFRPATVQGRGVRSTLDLPPIQFRLTD